MKLQMAETHDRCLTYISPSPHTIRSITSPNNAASWGQSAQVHEPMGCFSYSNHHILGKVCLSLGEDRKPSRKKKNELGPEKRGVEGFPSC